MTALLNFAFEETLVRVVERDGEPWFVGKDVCACLGIINHKDALTRLDDDEKAEVGIADPSGTKYATAVSEAGVYRLVFTSRKKQAERFKRWLAHDVVPAIRRTGSYGIPSAPVADPVIDDRARALAMVQECRQTHGRAAAARLWRDLGLPDVSAEPEPPRLVDDGPVRALAHLLDHPLEEGGTLRVLLAAAWAKDRVAVNRLNALNVSIVGFGFTLPLPSAALSRHFAGTEWSRWWEPLRRVDGVRSADPRGGRWGAVTLWLPSELLG